MTIRQRQIESVLKRSISETISRRLADPRIVGMVSITRIEVSPDMREAKVYVSVLPAKYTSRTVHGLRDAAGRIQHLVGKSLSGRTMPRLRFELDDTLKKQAVVFDAIRRGLDSSAVDREDSSQ